MWRTSYGDRTLNQHEAAVFLESVAHMRDMISVAVEMKEPHQVGVSSFDRLQPTQQLAALHTVTMALIKPEIEAPPLCSTLEGTVFAVFKALLSIVEVEIDACKNDDVSFELRKAILAALRSEIISDSDWYQPTEQELSELPKFDCDDIAAWESEIDILANQILWDRDFELEDLIADQDPVQVTPVKEYLGISDDYFATAAPDADSEEYLRLDRELVELRKSKPTVYE